ncbi:class I SAM-dependent methyltransferase [Frankia sp. Mgl5]|uniref:class I SAM-dependent methyltransferase n=1 Tax=Frankia sp. Mgl5 TaxID=2933793 RepID=UPI00200D240F|nr:class I SAM-dependent methyltransferase [Frankia sp. Mgl5]MCK9926676.1 class I SAM-dependent methyltransferase [Frankia sp. Mgl5]
MTIITGSATATGTPDGTSAAVEAFAQRVFDAVLGAQEVQAIYLGDRLGYYAALAERGPLTSSELAGATGSTERYAREWLEHQAVCGYLTVAADVDQDGNADRGADGSRDEHGDRGAGAEPAGDGQAAGTTEALSRRYLLPAGHAEVLADVDSLNYLAPLARFVAGAGRQLGEIAEAFRTGGGVSWERFGADAREAQAAANRPMFLSLLCQELLPAAPEVHATLVAGARVADIGCGAGWSSVALARAYPGVTVDGFDPDTESVRLAERNAAAFEVTDRVTFTDADADAAQAADGEAVGGYDLVFAFECVHDMADPVAVLDAARRLLTAGGSMIVMDERCAESFHAPAGEIERLLYGYSLIGCLPDGMSRQPSVGTGTVMRPATLAGYAELAGFTSTETLPIEHDFFRFYRLVP